MKQSEYWTIETTDGFAYEVWLCVSTQDADKIVKLLHNLGRSCTVRHAKEPDEASEMAKKICQDEA